MDIKNKPTLAEKQAFWAEQLPNFEAKYWLPSHFELLEFDMEGGNYEVRDVLPEHYSEGDAVEIWHRVNTGWAMWKKAINFTKAQAVPEPSIDLTGHDIKFITNFMCYSDLDNLDTEVTIQKCESGFDGAGLYAWVSEYPEEGGIKLGEAQEPAND